MLLWLRQPLCRADLSVGGCWTSPNTCMIFSRIPKRISVHFRTGGLSKAYAVSHMLLMSLDFLVYLSMIDGASENEGAYVFH